MLTTGDSYSISSVYNLRISLWETQLSLLDFEFEVKTKEFYCKTIWECSAPNLMSPIAY